MDTLYRNDRPGEMPGSWYAASADVPALRPSLDGDTRADVCIVGAGFTGLCAALELGKRGFNVIVLEAHRAGFGASGRNGGQVGSGYNKDQAWLEARVGHNAAHAMWDMAEAAKDQVRRYAAEHAPDARFTAGVAHGAYSAAEARGLAENAEYLATHYGYSDIETLDQPRCNRWSGPRNTWAEKWTGVRGIFIHCAMHSGSRALQRMPAQGSAN